MDKNFQIQIAEFLAIEEDEACRAGGLRYMARSMVPATMPHGPPQQTFFQRTNGSFTLSIVALPHVGLPYGSIPRVALCWVTTEAGCLRDGLLRLQR